jgi:hypothetical protein
MKEDFLHYIWQFQQFNKTNLFSFEGNELNIIKVGQKNLNSGPDFSEARISVDGIEWAGQVEIHIFSDEWYKHKHEEDFNYQNVILHVVWEHKIPVKRTDGTIIPTLELKSRIFQDTLGKYYNLLAKKHEITCASSFKEVSELTKLTMLEKALANRIEKKTEFIGELLKKCVGDWEEVSYRVFLKNFGFKLNSDSFLRLAENLPLKILLKHKDNTFQIEALLFGQAGFLDLCEDDYSKQLKTEYDFLAHKYGLKNGKMLRTDWKFLRTRPGNFPTVRLAQLAAIIQKIPNVFSFIISNPINEDAIAILRASLSTYWQEHYDFNKLAKNKLAGLGRASAENVLINTFVNLLAAYSSAVGNHTYFEKAIGILEQLKPENNFITDKWNNLGLEIKSSFDSQAVIEQYNEFCLPLKCLSCPIGINILQTK